MNLNTIWFNFAKKLFKQRQKELYIWRIVVACLGVVFSRGHKRSAARKFHQQTIGQHLGLSVLGLHGVLHGQPGRLHDHKRRIHRLERNLGFTSRLDFDYQQSLVAFNQFDF